MGVMNHECTMAVADSAPPVLTFAVDSDGALGALTDVEEAMRDDVTGRAAVQEEEVVVVEAGVAETLGVVDLLVEPHHRGHAVLPEVGEVGLRGVQGVSCRGRGTVTAQVT